jgi:hypothetical protein
MIESAILIEPRGIGTQVTVRVRRLQCVGLGAARAHPAHISARPILFLQYFRLRLLPPYPRRPPLLLLFCPCPMTLKFVEPLPDPDPYLLLP